MKHNQYSKKLAHNKRQDTELLTKILVDACKHFHISYTEMMGSSNTGDIALARQVAIYLGYVEAGFDYRELQDKFKRKAHSRCVYAFKIIEDYLSNENTPTAQRIIKFFRMHGYCKDRFKPYLKLEKKVA